MLFPLLKRTVICGILVDAAEREQPSDASTALTRSKIS
jgi:hypothetical protein